MIQCFPVTKMQEHLFLNPKKCEQYIADCLVIIFCCSKRRSSDCGLNWACTLQKPWSPWQLHRARPFSKKYLFWVCLVEMWQKWEDSLKRKMKMNVSTLNLFYFIFNLALSWHWLATLLTSQVICKTGTHTTWSNTHTHSSPASRVWNLHLSVTALSVHSTTSHGNLTWPNCVKSILTQPLFFFSSMASLVYVLTMSSPILPFHWWKLAVHPKHCIKVLRMSHSTNRLFSHS